MYTSAKIVRIAVDSAQPWVAKRHSTMIAIPAVVVTLELPQDFKLTTDEKALLVKNMAPDYRLDFGKPRTVTMVMDARKVEQTLTHDWQLSFVSLAETCKNTFLYCLNDLTNP